MPTAHTGPSLRVGLLSTGPRPPACCHLPRHESKHIFMLAIRMAGLLPTEPVLQRQHWTSVFPVGGEDLSGDISCDGRSRCCPAPMSRDALCSPSTLFVSGLRVGVALSARGRCGTRRLGPREEEGAGKLRVNPVNCCRPSGSQGGSSDFSRHSHWEPVQSSKPRLSHL